MKRIAAGAHLPILWVFGAAKFPDDKAQYCLEFELNAEDWPYCSLADPGGLRP